SRDLLFEFVFTYSGGETDLIFDYFDLGQNFDFYLIDGCVCNNPISYPAIFHISFNNNALEGADVIIQSVSQFSDSLGITIFNLTPGDYAYTVSKPNYQTIIDTLTISNTSQIIEVEMLLSVNIQDNTFSDLKVFPNPSNGMFYFETKDFQSNPVEISVIDLTGKLISIGKFANSSKISINLLEQPKGMYLTQIKSGSIIFYQKLLVR
ncbi:MAG: hypothetical protein B6D61_10625, partial [Bacteroidetes bacterium 4484_249]